MTFIVLSPAQEISVSLRFIQFHFSIEAEGLTSNMTFTVLNLLQLCLLPHSEVMTWHMTFIVHLQDKKLRVYLKCRDYVTFWQTSTD